MIGENLITPKERLLEIAAESPSQCVVVAICGDNIKISYSYRSLRELDAMLKALTDDLQKKVKEHRPMKIQL